MGKSNEMAKARVPLLASSPGPVRLCTDMTFSPYSIDFYFVVSTESCADRKKFSLCSSLINNFVNYFLIEIRGIIEQFSLTLSIC